MLPTRLTFTISILIPISFLASRFSISRLGFGFVEDEAEQGDSDDASSSGQWWWLRAESVQAPSSDAPEPGVLGPEDAWSRENARPAETAATNPGCSEWPRELEDDCLVVEMDKIMALVLRDFVDDWYKATISQEDEEFSAHVRTIVRNLVRAIVLRLRALNVTSLARLLRRFLVLLRQHIRCYKQCKLSHASPGAPVSGSVGAGKPDEQDACVSAQDTVGCTLPGEGSDDPDPAPLPPPAGADAVDFRSSSITVGAMSGSGAGNGTDSGCGPSARTRSVPSSSQTLPDGTAAQEDCGGVGRSSVGEARAEALGAEALTPAEAIARQYQDHLLDPVAGMLHPGALSVADEVKYWRAVLGALFHTLLPGLPPSAASSAGWAMQVAPGADEYVDAMRSGVMAIIREILAGRVMGYCVSNLADRFNQLVVQATKAGADEPAATAGAEGSGGGEGAGIGRDAERLAQSAGTCGSDAIGPEARGVARRGAVGHRRVQSDGGVSCIGPGARPISPSPPQAPTSSPLPSGPPTAPLSGGSSVAGAARGGGGALGWVDARKSKGKCEDRTAAAAADKRKRTALSPFRTDGVRSWFRGRRGRRSHSEERERAGAGIGSETDEEKGEVEALVSHWWAEVISHPACWYFLILLCWYSGIRVVKASGCVPDQAPAAQPDSANTGRPTPRRGVRVSGCERISVARFADGIDVTVGLAVPV